jgi:thiol:disulfide interchange protein DsbD
MRCLWAPTALVIAFLISGISLGAASGSAQDKSLLKVTSFLSQDKIRQGDTFKAAFRVSIAPGYHINGSEIADPYLVPTELVLDEQPGLKVEEYLYPAARTAKFSFSESELLVYEGDVVLAVLISAGKELATGTRKLKGKLLYQACNNVSCLPPSEILVEIPLDVVPSSQATKATNQEIFSKFEFKKDKKPSG